MGARVLHAEIRVAWRTALLATADLGLSAFHWQGERFVPVVGTPYLRESVRPLSSRVVATGRPPLVRHRLTLGATLFFPAGQGTLDAEYAAGVLVEAFAVPRQLIFGSTVARVKQAERGDCLTLEPDWQQLPVSIVVTADTAG